MKTDIRVQYRMVASGPMPGPTPPASPGQWNDGAQSRGMMVWEVLGTSTNSTTLFNIWPASTLVPVARTNVWNADQVGHIRLGIGTSGLLFNINNSSAINTGLGVMGGVVDNIINSGVKCIMNFAPGSEGWGLTADQILDGGVNFSTYLQMLTTISYYVASKNWSPRSVAIGCLNEPTTATGGNDGYYAMMQSMFHTVRNILPYHRISLGFLNFAGANEMTSYANFSKNDFDSQTMFDMHCYYPQSASWASNTPANVYWHNIWTPVYPPSGGAPGLNQFNIDYPAYNIRYTGDPTGIDPSTVASQFALEGLFTYYGQGFNTGNVGAFIDLTGRQQDATWLKDWFYKFIENWRVAKGLVPNQILIGEYGITHGPHQCTNRNQCFADISTAIDSYGFHRCVLGGEETAGTSIGFGLYADASPWTHFDPAAISAIAFNGK